jgi:hypothetical protein
VGPDGILCGACARGAALPGERLAAGALPALAALGKRDLLSLAGEPLSEVELQGAGRFARALMRDLLGRDLRSTVYLRRYHLDSI